MKYYNNFISFYLKKYITNTLQVFLTIFIYISLIIYHTWLPQTVWVTAIPLHYFNTCIIRRYRRPWVLLPACRGWAIPYLHLRTLWSYAWVRISPPPPPPPQGTPRKPWKPVKQWNWRSSPAWILIHQWQLTFLWDSLDFSPTVFIQNVLLTL